MRLWREHLATIATTVVVCVASLTSVAAAAWQAWQVAELPSASAPYEWVGSVIAARVSHAADIDRVLDADPFRFGALHDASADAADSAGVVTEQECRLLGTVVGLDGDSFAMCDVGGVSRVVRQGQKVGAWTLLRVERAQVVFRDKEGAAVTLKVAQPGGVVP